MPLVPQYRSLESAAALETLANPKRTKTTLGKQHIKRGMRSRRSISTTT